MLVLAGADDDLGPAAGAVADAVSIEFLCLLPLTIPAIVLVVGLAPIYRQIRIYYSLSALMLFGIYVVLALPYAYRALASGLESIDARTLSEAARSLGAAWFTDDDPRDHPEHAARRS